MCVRVHVCAGMYVCTSSPFGSTKLVLRLQYPDRTFCGNKTRGGILLSLYGGLWICVDTYGTTYHFPEHRV